MTELVLVLLTSFTLTFLMMPLFIKYLSKKEILDIPGGRKIHRGAKPSLGGIPMFLSFVASVLIWLPLDSWHLLRFTLLSQSLIFIIGVRDDLLPLRALYKLFGQLIAISIIIFIMDVRIKSLEGFLGIHEIPFAISVILTYLVIVGITNAFNLIDGLDGLAGAIALITLATLGLWFYLNNSLVEALIVASLAGAIVAFLIFNWQPSLIFMGDTGSLVIGLTISIALIQFLNLSVALPVTSGLKFNCPIALACCSAIVPITDTARIIILRITKGQSPFRPDKNHVHHAIMRLGMSHERAVIVLGSFQILCIAVCVIFREVPDQIMLPVTILLSITGSVIIDKLINKKARK